MVILWWTPCSSCRAVHSASLKLLHPFICVVVMVGRFVLSSILCGWSSVASFHDRCAWAAGQTGLGGRDSSGSWVTCIHQQAGHIQVGHTQVTHVQAHGGGISSGPISSAWQEWQVCIQWHHLLVCVCVCVPVKPTRGNTT